MLLSKLRKVMGWVVVLVMLAGVTPLFAQTGGLTGVCKGDKGELLVGYPVIIERQEVKGIYKTKTNKKGEYVYIGLALGNYKITLQDPSGRQLFFVTTRVGMGDLTEQDFDLAKERVLAQEDRAKQIAANPELARQVQEQEKAQKQTASLKQLFDQGQALMDEKKYVEAAAMFDQALPLAKDKNVPVVLGKLAESYQKAGQYDKALEHYLKAIQIKPEDAPFHNNLGNVYAEMGKATEAAAEFQKAAELDPAQASRFYFNYGAVMYNTGKMDEAAGAFKKATEIDANFADAYYWLGLALMGKATMNAEGKVTAPPGTSETLETYLKLDPNGKNAASAQAMLQTVQGQIQIQYKAEKKKKK